MKKLKSIKGIFCMILCAALVLTAVQFVCPSMMSETVYAAQTTGSYKVTASSLNVRSGAGTSYSRIGSLTKGAVVQVLEVSSNNWGKITYNSQTGWISLAYCEKQSSGTTDSSSSEGNTSESTSSTDTTSGTVYKVTASSLNVRSGAGTGYKKLGYLNNGALVTVLEVSSNNWGKINYNSQTGWISLSYCEKQNSTSATDTSADSSEQSTDSGETGTGESTSTDTSTGQTTTGTSYKVTASSLNVRSGAGTGYTRLGTLANGTVVTVLEVSSSNWGKINYNGKEGWISLTYCSKVTSNSSTGTGSSSTTVTSTKKTISWNSSWKYASYSKVHSSSVTLYRSTASNRNGIVVAVNAGHGSLAAQKVYTLCHPDGSAKLVSGSTAAGSTTALGATSGTTLSDGTSEAAAVLAASVVIKNTLLENGYDVLMIREASDCSLDNIARTVYANNNADCHIAIHYDSTTTDKGLFCINVPSNSSYLSMEPVASHYKQHNALCKAIVAGAKSAGVKIFSDGLMEMDLTQTSYSTVPSADVEIGDQKSAHNTAYYQKVANGISKGLDSYFGISR